LYHAAIELEGVHRLIRIDVGRARAVRIGPEPGTAEVEQIGGEAGRGQPAVAAGQEAVDLGRAVAVLVDGELLGGVLELFHGGRHFDPMLLEQVRADVQELGLGRPDHVVERLALDHLLGVDASAEPVVRIVEVGRRQLGIGQVGLQRLQVSGQGQLAAPVVHLQHDDVEGLVLASQHDVLLLAHLAGLQHLEADLDAGLLLELLGHGPEPGVDVADGEAEHVERGALELAPVDLVGGGGRGAHGQGQEAGGYDLTELHGESSLSMIIGPALFASSGYRDRRSCAYLSSASPCPWEGSRPLRGRCELALASALWCLLHGPGSRGSGGLCSARCFSWGVPAP
jgi:hypothetical protein